jgi:transposase
MYIQRSYKKVGDKVYQTVFLRESYRENGKNKKRSIKNISDWAPEKIASLERALKHENLVSTDEIGTESGKSFGALFAFASIAKSLRLPEILGSSRSARFALTMACLRPIKALSKLGTIEMVKNQAVEELLGVSKVDEDDLYGALDYLEENQAAIEDALFKQRGSECQTLFMYDVTSSYLEGKLNELACYGYNRDKKNGKKQIVIGLLKDKDGRPVTVQVYEGNTNDHKTVADQIQKLKERFGVERIAMVGDRGMLKHAQIEALGELQWNYITALTKPQIRSMVSSGVIQLSLFDETVCEVDHDGQRLVLRRNAKRAAEAAATRVLQLKRIEEAVQETNQKLLNERVDKDKNFQKLCALVGKYKVEKYISLKLVGNRVKALRNDAKLEEDAKLDGCYALVTDLPKNEFPAQSVHDRYKDLKWVELAFRMMKSSLEVRPMWHRRADRTRGHVFMVMLALLLMEEFHRSIQNLKISTESAIDALNNIQLTEITAGKHTIHRLPKRLRTDQFQILEALKLKLPVTVKRLA